MGVFGFFLFGCLFPLQGVNRISSSPPWKIVCHVPLEIFMPFAVLKSSHCRVYVSFCPFQGLDKPL